MAYVTWYTNTHTWETREIGISSNRANEIMIYVYEEKASVKSPTAVKVNLGLYQLDIFNIPSWDSFKHFNTSFCKGLSGMPYILGKKYI